MWNKKFIWKMGSWTPIKSKPYLAVLTDFNNVGALLGFKISGSIKLRYFIVVLELFKYQLSINFDDSRVN